MEIENQEQCKATNLEALEKKSCRAWEIYFLASKPNKNHDISIIESYKWTKTLHFPLQIQEKRVKSPKNTVRPSQIY